MNYNRTNLARHSRVADTLARAPRVGGSRSKWKKKLRKKACTQRAPTDDGEKWVIYGDFPRANYQYSEQQQQKNTPQLEKRREKKVVRFDIAVESRESSGERWINMGNFCWLWQTNVVRYQMSHGDRAHQRAREITKKKICLIQSSPLFCESAAVLCSRIKKSTLTYLAHFVCRAVRCAYKKLYFCFCCHRTQCFTQIITLCLLASSFSLKFLLLPVSTHRSYLRSESRW